MKIEIFNDQGTRIARLPIQQVSDCDLAGEMLYSFLESAKSDFVEYEYDRAEFYSMVTGYWVNEDGLALDGPGGVAIERYPGEIISSDPFRKNGSNMRDLVLYGRTSEDNVRYFIARNVESGESEKIFITDVYLIYRLIRESAEHADGWATQLLPIQACCILPSHNFGDYSDTVAEIIYSYTRCSLLRERVKAGLVTNRTSYGLDLLSAITKEMDPFRFAEMPISMMRFILDLINLDNLRENFRHKELVVHAQHRNPLGRRMFGLSLLSEKELEQAKGLFYLSVQEASYQELLYYVCVSFISPVCKKIISLVKRLEPKMALEYSGEKNRVFEELKEMAKLSLGKIPSPSEIPALCGDPVRLSESDRAITDGRVTTMDIAESAAFSFLRDWRKDSRYLVEH